MPHKPRYSVRLAVLLAVTALLCGSFAAFAADPVEVVHARIRLIPGGGPQAGYFTVLNHGPAAVRLSGASSAVFKHVMMHRSVVEGGMARMEALPQGIKVPAGGEVDFAPEGLHLMLMGAKQPLQIGQRIPIALHFAQGPPRTVDFVVVPLKLD